MNTSYVPYQPDQQYLLPCSLQEWLPQGHLAYFISDTVDSLNLGAFHARYAGGGSRNQPFHPSMMVKVLVYAYATGVFSSRKIAKKLSEDVAFRVLGADNFPAHRTIRDFRALHLAEFTELFVQVVRLAREMGLVKLGTIAVDGTKIKANAKVLAKPRDAQRYPHTVAMAAKFETEQGKTDYRKRKWIAEPPNGWIKNVLGFRQFSMRGLQKTQAEFKLVCMALNLRRMGAMQAH